MDEPKILFYKGLSWYYAIGQALPWANEIHIDEEYKTSPYLNKIIEHEKKHIELFNKGQNTKSGIKRLLIAIYESFWNIASCYKLHYRISKEDFIYESIVFFGFPIILILKFLIWG